MVVGGWGVLGEGGEGGADLGEAVVGGAAVAGEQERVEALEAEKLALGSAGSEGGHGFGDAVGVEQEQIAGGEGEGCLVVGLIFEDA